MQSYPRQNDWQFRPAPAYMPLSVGRKVIAVVAAAGIIGTLLFFISEPIWLSQKTFTFAARPAPAEQPTTSAIGTVATTPVVEPPAPAIRPAPSPFSFAGTAGVELDFAPRAGSDRLLYSLIRHAQSSIKLQAFQVNTLPMQQALRDALQRGANVEILVDDAISKDSKAALDSLRKAGAVIHVNARSGEHHDKTIIVDDKDILVGSINYSRDTKDLDFTNVMVISNPEVAKLYLDHWNTHLAASRPR